MLANPKCVVCYTTQLALTYLAVDVFCGVVDPDALLGELWFSRPSLTYDKHQCNVNI